MIPNRLLHQVYLWGYAGHVLPRRVRQAIAGSALHRARFLGFHGFFEQDGTSYGLARPYHAITFNNAAFQRPMIGERTET